MPVIDYKKKLEEQVRGIESKELHFPRFIMRGVAGDYATAYSDITEAPKHFYYMAYLTCLGSILADNVRLKTLLNVQPRLYTIFLGQTGRGRKSTPIAITIDFFKQAFDDFNLMHHANSGEGLGVFLEKSPRTLLVYDEFMGFVSKAIQKGNTLLGTVTTLFEKNQYQTATKEKQLLIENAYLSILAACTTDTWERCWHPDFTAIGLVNRLFLVCGGMEKLAPIPPVLEIGRWKNLLQNTRAVVKLAQKIHKYELTPESVRLYDQWYRNTLDHKSVHSVRLDAYALRLMLLLAIVDERYQIDTDIVQDVIQLVTWEHAVRQQLDPIDADNEQAKIELRIRRNLLLGPLTKRALQQKTGAHRSGTWLWHNALSGLLAHNEIAYNNKTKEYYILSNTEELR